MNEYMSKHRTTFNAPDWYLLVDGAQLTEQQIQNLKRSGARAFLSDMEEFEHLEGATAWLMAMGGSANAFEVLTTWWTINPEACSWLYFPGGMTALVQHLRNQIKAKVEDGRVLTLRFWDARVFLALQHPELASIALRVGSGVPFWFVAPQSVLSAVTSDAPLVADTHPHAIAKAQQDRLAQLLLPYAVLGELKETMPEMLSLFTRQEQYSTTSNLITAAQGYGLEALNDLVAFASLGFDFHPEFYKHPDVAPKLDELRTGKELGEVVDSIPPQTWDAIGKRYPKSKQALEI